MPYLAVKLLLGALVGGGSVAALFLAAAPLIGRARATAAALLGSAHFGLYVLSVAPVADGLFQVLLLVALALFVRALDLGRRPAWRPALALGCVLGVMALTRAEGLAYGALLLGAGAVVSWRSVAGTGRGRSLRAWGLAAAALVLVVLPWTVRNAVRLAELERSLAGRLAEPLPRFVPITLYGPLNLALANHGTADGSFSRAVLAEGAASGSLDFTRPEHLRYVLHGDEIAAAWIRDHPAAFARLVARKLRLYLGALKLGWTQWNIPAGLTGLRRPVDLLVPDSAATLWLVLPLLLVGAATLARGTREERHWLALVGGVTLLSVTVAAAFFGYARLGLVPLPLWLTLLACGVERLGRPLGRARGLGSFGQRLAWIVIGLLVALEAFGAWQGHRLEATGTTLPGSSRIDRDQPVRMRPLPDP